MRAEDVARSARRRSLRGGAVRLRPLHGFERARIEKELDVANKSVLESYQFRRPAHTDRVATVIACDRGRPATNSLQKRCSMARKKAPSELRLCPAVGFSQIVGGKYKLRILWILIQRPYRYGEIRTSLLKGTLGKPVTPRVLSRELKELQHRGLIHRKQYDVVPLKVEYSLTDLGRGLQPVLESVVEWRLTGAHEEILGMNVNPPTSTVKGERAGA